MSRVSRDDVTEYQNVAEQLEDAARQALAAMLAGQDLAAVGELEDDKQRWSQVLEIIAQVFGQYGNQAAGLGTMWYQRCRDVETDYNGVYVAEPYFDDAMYARITKRAHTVLYNARRDIKHKGATLTNAQIVDSLCEVLGDGIAKANRDAVRYNMQRENDQKIAYSKRPETARYEKPQKSVDEMERRELIESIREEYGQSEPRETKRNVPDRKTQQETGYTYPTSVKVKFMRVPHADCKCSFCITLASRGAVYLTRERAGGRYGDEANKFHDHCRCAIVPVSRYEPYIAGYDEEMNRYYDMYADAHAELENIWEYKRNGREGELSEQDQEILKRIDDAYARHKAQYDADPENTPKWKEMNELSIAMRVMNEGMT